MQDKRTVVAYRDPALRYPTVAPFDPDTAFPEYPFDQGALLPGNSVYGAVREVLHLAGLDAARFGTPSWNPLGDLVHPGETVVIKPNWVRHYHQRGEDIFSLITHPAVLRPLVDYAYLAVGQGGRVWILDAPLFDTDYPTLERVCQLKELEKFLRDRKIPLMIADLRSLVAKIDRGVVIRRHYRNSWSSEGIEFDLGSDSEFYSLGSTLKNVFGSDYNRRITQAFHSQLDDGRQRNCYLISRRVLDADLIISVPKLKTHKKTGVTLNVKNMIGINTDKNYIPHYRVGSPSQNGDEFPDTNSKIKQGRRWLVRQSVDLFLARFGQLSAMTAHMFMTILLFLKRESANKNNGRNSDPIDIFYQTIQGDKHRTGNWWGNDTCWRCGLDINKILLFGSADGKLADQPVRRYFSLVDGIVSGEGEGPLAPTPRLDGVMIAGFDPISVDLVSTQIMGFDPNLIRDLQQAIKPGRYPLTDSTLPINVRSNYLGWRGCIHPGSYLGFRPHPGWSEYLKLSHD